MIVAGISFLISVASAPAAESDRSALSVFRDACVGGEARLSETDARPIKRKEVPGAILRHLSGFPWHLTSTTQFYRLSMPEGPAFLVIQPSTGRSSGGRYCSVGSNHIKYWDARVAIEQNPQNLAMIPASERRHMESMGYSHATSTFGYETDVRRVDNGFIVMTTFLPDRKTDR
jgi:hypothetical protein